jgi:hypothetical protein
LIVLNKASPAGTASASDGKSAIDKDISPVRGIRRSTVCLERKGIKTDGIPFEMPKTPGEITGVIPLSENRACVACQRPDAVDHQNGLSHRSMPGSRALGMFHVTRLFETFGSNTALASEIVFLRRCGAHHQRFIIGRGTTIAACLALYLSSYSEPSNAIKSPM